jgi:hypothetical protein
MVEAVRELQQENISKNFMLKCVIPAEIYEDLTFDNPAKYVQKTVFLRWQYRDLLLLLAKRFLGFLKENDIACKSLPGELARKTIREDFWYQLVPKEINNDLGFLEDSMAYMLRHTQKKPRQVINLMNHVIRNAFERNSDILNLDDVERPLIQEGDFTSGIHENDCMLRSLNDALSVFSRSDEVSLTIKVRSAFEQERSKLEAIEVKEFSNRIYDNFKNQFDYAHPEEFTEVLFRSGLLGTIQRKKTWTDNAGNEANYYITEFEYLFQGRLAFAKHLTYGIHEILSDALRLDKYRDQGMIYPRPEPDEIPSLVGTELSS